MENACDTIHSMDKREEISHKLRAALGKLSTGIEVKVSVPEDLTNGDYTSNVAMVSFAKAKDKFKTPLEWAEYLVEELKKDAAFSADFSSIEAVKPGFINLSLSNRFLSTKLNSLLDGKKKVAETIKTSSIVFEFGDPNPFKEPHIGHLRNFALGESISRLIEETGKRVFRASYQGDVGLHVAKAIWGMIELKYDDFEAKSIEEKNEFLSKAYVLGASEYEKNDKVKQEIGEINKKVYENEPEIKKIWEKGRSWSIEHLEKLYQVLGINYSKFYFESETAPLGKEIILKNSPKVFEQNDGAYVFRGEPFGLHTRVFLTKDGYATYEGKDLALAVLKKKDYGDSASVIMTANEQIDYFKVVLKALSLVDKDLGEKTKHLSFGFVNLKDGKMSSRTGNVVSAFWLLEETKKRLQKDFKQVESKVLEQLAVGAVKWSMLKFSREADMAFSFEDSISTEGNSGPYLQYSYARTQSILAKKSEAKELGNLEGSELALARLVCQFENVVSDASSSFSPNILANYLFRLSQEFNSFYEKEKILGSNKEEQRILLTKAVGIVLKRGLYLLGIDAPDKI